MAKRNVRQPDSDLIAYLTYVGDNYTVDDIANVLAEVSGHAEEEDWFWILKLTDGSYALTRAWCDMTGWDCEAGGETEYAKTALSAAKLAPENDKGRDIRANLIAQLKGEIPAGFEVWKGYRAKEE